MLNKYKIIINSFKYNSRHILNNFYMSPFYFNLTYKIKYDKKKIKKYINKYYLTYINSIYNENDLWMIQKNSFYNSYNKKNLNDNNNIILCTSKELLELENNKLLLIELNKSKYVHKNILLRIYKYIENPFLYKNKKSEIRVFVVIYCYKKKDKLYYKIYLYNKILLKYEKNIYDKKNININNVSFKYKWLNEVIDNNIFKIIYNNVRNIII